jgi:hypothetical protein
MRVSIIGTAGRKEDAAKMSALLFENMVRVAREQIALLEATDGIDLVSGGAAWADFVAVQLWLDGNCPDVRSLTLHLPCGWDRSKNAFCGRRNNGLEDKSRRHCKLLFSTVFVENGTQYVGRNGTSDQWKQQRKCDRE